TVGDCGDDTPASGLDVISVQRVTRAGEPRGRLNADRRRAASLDPDTHLLQKLAEFDDVRFGCGVTDLGAPARGGGGQQRRFGAGYGRLVEIDGCAGQSGCRERIAG